MTSPDPTPKSQDQILVELEATLKTLLVVLKDTIQVKENAEVSQERIQDLIERIEQIETNPTEISELTAAIEQLVIYIQKIPRTDLNPLSTKLDRLERQVAAHLKTLQEMQEEQLAAPRQEQVWAHTECLDRNIAFGSMQAGQQTRCLN